MKKVLLLIEDYTERAFLNGLLKKVGWDVEATQSEMGINDLLLGFSPEVVIATGFGTKVHGEQLPEKLHRLSLKTQVLLIVKKRPISEEERLALGVLRVFQSPVDVQALFHQLEAMGGIPAEKAFAKLASRAKSNVSEAADKWVHSKAKQTEESLDSASVHGSDKEESFVNPLKNIATAQEKIRKYKFEDPDRMKAYSKFVQDNPLPETKFNGLDPQMVQDQVDEFRRLEDDPEIESIDDERKDFAVAMFRLAKESKPS